MTSKFDIPVAKPIVSFETVDLPEDLCPGCHHTGLTQFYYVSSMPVHSCLLMDTREEALQHPRGELRLAFCPTCGLISNVAYDPSNHDYSGRYEETQGFSPTFNSSTQRIVEQLIEQHELRNRTVLEIGCGKGEFLALLCREGNNRGVGVDPSFVPGRLPPDLEARLNVYREFYGPQHFGLNPDFVCCRHTLEHIPNVYEFIQMVRAGIGQRHLTSVFFDLPDTLRILHEGAFWDLYYEHCSYFTLGSLARVFRASRFEIQDLWREYGDQWLMLSALPADAPTCAQLAEEDDLPTVESAVRAFADRCGSVMQHWQNTIDEIVKDGGRPVVWGSGSKGVSFLTTLGVGKAIEYVVDINPHRHGKFMPGSGQPIVGPDMLADYAPTHVIVMNPIYCDEIGRDLERLGISASLLAV